MFPPGLCWPDAGTAGARLLSALRKARDNHSALAIHNIAGLRLRSALSPYVTLMQGHTRTNLYQGASFRVQAARIPIILGRDAFPLSLLLPTTDMKTFSAKKQGRDRPAGSSSPHGLSGPKALKIPRILY